MIVHTMYNGLQVTIPANAYSLEGFRAWATSDNFPDAGRITYLNGEVYVDMSPEKFESHNKVKTEVARVLGNLAKELDLGNYCTNGQWITNDHADLSNEPDGTFVSWSKLESGQVRVIPLRASEQDGIELRGTPDWVLEVVSDSSVIKDTQVLLDGYHRANTGWSMRAAMNSISRYFIFFLKATRQRKVPRVGCPPKSSTASSNWSGTATASVAGRIRCACGTEPSALSFILGSAAGH